MKFSGKNVLITGASRGIGAQIAKTLAQQGLKVWRRLKVLVAWRLLLNLM